MDASVYASLYRSWAIANGLLSEELIGVDENIDLNAAHPGGRNVTQEYFDILRHRRVNFLTFNDEEQTVKVFTGLKVTKKEREKLDEINQVDELTIDYVQGNQATIRAVSADPVGVPACELHHGCYTCGSSIYPGNTLGAGTLGALVTDANGDIFGLSNNHVSGLCNFSELNLPVVAPGSVDVSAGGLDPFTIGHHTKLLPLTDGTPNNVNILNNQDAAIFKLKDPNLVSSMQRLHYDTPTNLHPLEPGRGVQKVGRSTGRTSGVVQGRTVGPVHIMYNYPADRLVFFSELVVITRSDGGDFALPGDSGALITTEIQGDRFSSGIVVGVNEQNKITYALPIEPILAALNVQLLGGHNV